MCYCYVTGGIVISFQISRSKKADTSETHREARVGYVVYRNFDMWLMGVKSS